MFLTIFAPNAYKHRAIDGRMEKGTNNIPLAKQQDERKKRIVKVGLWGVAVNFVYALLKGIIGMLSGSIAILIDAANNLNDAISSVIAVGGIKLAMRPADKYHPFGHGRIEYVSAMVISALIVILGITSFYNAVGKIIHPTETHYETPMLIVMATGVAAKLWLGIYTLRAGKREKSDSLNGSGAENLFDSLVTLGTIASALILIIWHIDLDGWMAAILSTVLVKAGLKILRRTFNEILGRRIDSQFSQMLKKEIKAFPKVAGAYDLIVNNYGPDSMVGSVNIEVPEQTTAKEIHELTQNIKQYIHQEYNIHLAVGIYAQSQNPETIKLREEIAAAVMKHPGAMEIHGFLLNENQKKISFDVVADFSVKNHHTFCNQIATQLHAAFPKYTFAVNADLDYSD